MSADIPCHRLPPVGRHTEILEQTEQGLNPYQASAAASAATADTSREGRVSLRRPSIVETPDLNKAKLESQADKASAGTVVGAITPGQPIFGTQEDSPEPEDVDIHTCRSV